MANDRFVSDLARRKEIYIAPFLAIAATDRQLQQEEMKEVSDPESRVAQVSGVAMGAFHDEPSSKKERQPSQVGGWKSIELQRRGLAE